MGKAKSPLTPLLKGGVGGFYREMPGKQCQLSFAVHYNIRTLHLCDTRLLA